MFKKYLCVFLLLSVESVFALSRQKFHLERFDLEELTYRGTIEIDGQILGLIVDAEGGLNRVSVSSFVGKHIGLVIKIENKLLTVCQIVRSGDSWIPQKVVISIARGEHPSQFSYFDNGCVYSDWGLWRKK